MVLDDVSSHLFHAQVRSPATRCLVSRLHRASVVNGVRTMLDQTLVNTLVCIQKLSRDI